MDNSKKKIFIITQPEVTHVTGGAVNIFTNICNLLADNGYTVYAICSSEIDKKVQDLNNQVIFVNLFTKNKKHSFSKSINLLAKEIKPNLFIFFFSYLYETARLKSEFDNIPRILMFHSRPDIEFLSKSKEKKLKRFYNNTISQVLFDSFKPLLPDFIQKGNVVTIPNGIYIPNKTIDTNAEHKKIIYLSRIDYWKGVEFLINSFKLIAEKYPDWSIDIYGQSQPKEYVNKLIDLCKERKLDKQIHFKGITNEPLETMLNYDFCVFPSYVEGFGLGLAEALSVGLPSIGLKECTGVNELIIDGENGFLTEENFEDFAHKIEILINNIRLRKEFSKKAINSVKKFENKMINQSWLNLVKDTINRNCISKPIFSIEKLLSMIPQKKFCYKPLEYIFSLKNSSDRTYKIITLFGLQIRIKRINNYKER